MDGHRSVDGPSERTGPTASFEREIESLLAVEPSPEFLARVRTRVAQEPEPGGWRLSWLVAATSAVVVAAVAVMVWPSADVTPSNAPSLDPPRVAEVTEPIAPASSSVAQIRATQATRAAGATRGVHVEAMAIDLPEVVLGANEVNAYTALVARIRQRRFDVVVPTAPDPGVPLEVKELPPLEPLEIEPIVKLATLE